MNKSDLIDLLAEKIKVPRKKAEEVVEVIFDSMIEAMKTGDRIEIRGFGSFIVKNYKPYRGRNPRTGVAIEVKPKKLPFFKVGKELRARVDHPHTTMEKASQEETGETATTPVPKTNP